MKRTFLKLLILLLLIAESIDLFAQKTYHYKRVMIVKNGEKANKNDDAHYITFTDKGCYESDKNGLSTNDGFVKFTKNENNIHCYYGKSSFGMAYYYFSNDYSRLNVQLSDDLIYVYQRVTNGETTARKRVRRSNNNGWGVGGYTISPSVPNNSGTSPSNGSTSGSGTSRHSSYTKCVSCNGTGVCNYCHGKCGEWKYVYDSHSWIECGSCRGSGRCGVCRGMGKY